jgi:DNA-binding transcriptional ArsR family regulator
MMVLSKNTLCKTRRPDRANALLSPADAVGVAGVFKVLANDTRLRILHLLCQGGEIAAGDLARSLGLKPQALSNQLTRLADLGVVAARREGIHIHYRVIDLCVSALIDKAICLMETTGEPPAGSRRAKSCAERKK